MRNFDLYVSGILYGRLRLGDGTPQIQKLDVHTGALLDWLYFSWIEPQLKLYILKI